MSMLTNEYDEDSIYDTVLNIRGQITMAELVRTERITGEKRGEFDYYTWTKNWYRLENGALYVTIVNDLSGHIVKDYTVNSTDVDIIRSFE